MRVVRCPDCCVDIELAEAAKSGDLVECPHCAGHALRVREHAGGWSATLAHRVSCPVCDAIVTLPEEVKPGDAMQCCGRTYHLTFSYGAFAAEEG